MTLDWLFAAPIAHRGLHDRAAGIIENTLTAATAAVARGFGIECDVQRTADGEAVIFHDFRLERLTETAGAVADMTVAALTKVVMRGSRDRIVPLDVFLRAFDGVVPVIVEIKSAFDGDMRLADRTAEVVAKAKGPLAIKSFDPDVIAHLRGHAVLKARGVPLGVVAERSYDADGSLDLSSHRKRELAEFLHYDRSRPDFISFCARDMPCAVPFLCRAGMGLPVMAWTIRSQAEAKHALAWSDQIVFEGFDPVSP